MLALDAIYLLVLLLATPWLVWRRIWQGKHRRGWGQKLLGLVPPTAPGNGPVIWLHAVSVGELNLLPPLLRELESQLPAVRFRITTSTESGCDHAIRLFGAERVSFCPTDFSWAVRRALRRIRPDLLVLMELELWPNLLQASRRAGVPVALVNARMSDRSFARLIRIPWLARRLLGRLDLVGAQSERYARRFSRLGVAPDRLAVTGNLKFDGANTDRNAPAIVALREKMGLPRDARIFVAGSTQPGEDLMAVEAWLAVRLSFPDLRLVVVPRHPHAADPLCRDLATRGLPFVRRSLDQRPDYGPAADAMPEIIVVDVIGELPAWWGLATVGFVGGSFGKRGGQSMIEPAALGVPVCFGPHTWNFRDAVAMVVEMQLGKAIADTGELRDFLVSALADRESRDRRAFSCRQVMAGMGRSAPLVARRLADLVSGSPLRAPKRRIA